MYLDLDLDKYISIWILLLFLIWYLLDKIGIHYKWFNLIDLSYLIFYGYIIILIYNNLPVITFELSFIILSIILHYIPLYYLTRYTKLKSDKYSLLLVVVVIILYLIYLKMNDINPIKLYLVDASERWPILWNKLKNIII
jgi:hypothetical protein